MLKRPFYILIITILLIGGGAAAYGAWQKHNAQTRPRTSDGPLGLEYYTPNQFQATIFRANQLADNFPRPVAVRAGIVPHDLTHAEYAVHLLKNLQQQKPKVIVLIGPNHFERGTSNLLTATADWTTPYGTVTANKQTITNLTAHSAVTVDNATLQHEHSINGLLPYLAYYLPGTQIIPLIVKAEVTQRDLDYLLDTLDAVLPPGTIFLASVDFSHYLTSEQAQTNDQVTVQALQTLDAQKIMSFGQRFNDYVDSPPSIALLLTWAKRQHLQGVTILNNTNSGLLAHVPSASVTSYFEVVYY